MCDGDIKWKNPKAFARDAFDLFDTIKEKMCEKNSFFDQICALTLLIELINKHKK